MQGILLPTFLNPLRRVDGEGKQTPCGGMFQGVWIKHYQQETGLKNTSHGPTQPTAFLTACREFGINSELSRMAALRLELAPICVHMTPCMADLANVFLG